MKCSKCLNDWPERYGPDCPRCDTQLKSESPLDTAACSASPCPLCAQEVEDAFFVTGMDFHWWICCKPCGLVLKRRANHSRNDDPARAEAIAAWNTRKPNVRPLATPPDKTS